MTYDDVGSVRTGRHCIFALHAHLVLVTKLRHNVFTDRHLTRMEEIMRGCLRRLRVRTGRVQH
ncbi:transposase [Micromonospora sp. NPDC049460]|uniref:transposase n=1 Tax=Micromonospora sp. NPDC049460 TaxID=3364272 RepID=UPI0037A9BEF6